MARIGVDLGGTKIELIRTTDNPLEVLDRVRVPTEKEQGYDHLVRQIVSLLESMRSQTEAPLRMGMGIPGAIDRDGTVVTSNIRCLEGHRLSQDLTTQLGQTVRVENDANCFALSEALHGAGVGYRMVFGLILGTGVGGGLVIDSQTWSGVHGIAGELGHVSVDYQGPQCYCGRRGCLELYLAGPSIQRAYEQQSGTSKGVPEIAQAAREGTDPVAQAVMSHFLDVYVEALSNLVAGLDPDAIVIGGGVSNLDLLYHEGAERVRSISLQKAQKTQILKNKLGDSSGVYGAATLA